MKNVKYGHLRNIFARFVILMRVRTRFKTCMRKILKYMIIIYEIKYCFEATVCIICYIKAKTFT